MSELSPSVRRASRVAWSVVVASLLSGCPNPLGYTTPRTVERGKVVQIVSFEAYDLRAGEDSILSPSAPSYQLRLGLAERFDLGFRAMSLVGLGIDAKYNFFQSEALDIAVDPAVGGLGVLAVVLNGKSNERPPNAYTLDLPLLVSVNLDPSVSVVLRGGYFWVSEADDRDEEAYRALSSVGPWRAVHAGAGLDVRVSRRFAVHPAFSVLVDAESGGIRGLVGGIGFALGRLPTYPAQPL